MKNISNINDRILYIIENQCNKNQKKFADLIGFSPQVIGNIVSGRKSKPSFDVLVAILSSFVDIDSEWLLTGKGEMLKQPKGPAMVPQDPKDQYIIDLQKKHIAKLEEELAELKKAQQNPKGYGMVAESKSKLKK